MPQPRPDEYSLPGLGVFLRDVDIPDDYALARRLRTEESLRFFQHEAEISRTVKG